MSHFRPRCLLFFFPLILFAASLGAQTLVLPLRDEITGAEVANLSTITWGSGFSSQAGEFVGDCMNWKGKANGAPIPKEKRSQVRSEDAASPQTSALLGGIRIEDSQGGFSNRSYENTSLAASIAQGAYSGSVSYKAITSTSSSKFERSILIVAAARFERELLDVTAVKPVDRYLKMLKEGRDQDFFKQCGDYFVKGFIYGGRLAANVHLRASSFHSFSSVNQKFDFAMNSAMSASMTAEQKKELEQFASTSEYTFNIIPDAILSPEKPLPTSIDALFEYIKFLPSIVNNSPYRWYALLEPYTTLGSFQDAKDASFISQDQFSNLTQPMRRWTEYRAGINYMVNHQGEFPPFQVQYALDELKSADEQVEKMEKAIRSCIRAISLKGEKGGKGLKASLSSASKSAACRSKFSLPPELPSPAKVIIYPVRARGIAIAQPVTKNRFPQVAMSWGRFYVTKPVGNAHQEGRERVFWVLEDNNGKRACYGPMETQYGNVAPPLIPPGVTLRMVLNDDFMDDNYEFSADQLRGALMEAFQVPGDSGLSEYPLGVNANGIFDPTQTAATCKLAGL
jgi:hypothetical protein